MEITPSDIRLRKRFLTNLDRRKHMRELIKYLYEEENLTVGEIASAYKIDPEKFFT